MPNDALRRALAERRMTPEELATRVGIDPKTVGRWLANPAWTPHPQTRWAVADALEVDEVALWPQAARAALKTGYDREVQAVYPSKAATPAEIWQKLVTNAEREIILCGTSPQWLWWYVPDLTGILVDKAAAGCRVRVLTGIPDDPMIAADQEATGSPITLAARIEQTRQLLEPLRGGPAEVRATPLGFGRSVYRGDREAVADWWLHGQSGKDFPVIHLRRRQDGGLFDQIAVRHAEALWNDAEAVWS